MAVPAPQRETAAFLERLAGAAPIETHASLVFVGKDTVWKLKKAVRLPFLDFTRIEDRRRFAERELALNAPAAAGLYRDVVPVIRRPDGSLALGEGPGRPADWVLRMARVPRGDFLDEMAREGRIGPPLLDALADVVAAYHAALPPVRGVVPRMDQIARGNQRSAQEAGLPDDTVSEWTATMLATLDRLGPWMAQRAAEGFVRRAHGDLHLGNLCMWRGRPVPFDALEFDEAMATIDLGYDLAFLLMDLEHRVSRAAANRVMNRYIARNGDVGLVRGLPAFLSMRAMVRAHVEARIGRTDPAPYLNASMNYLRPSPPVMVAIGGLPGTGKSTLARALAPTLGAAPGALVLRSDEIRKRRFGVAPEQRLPPAAYEEHVSAAVFATLIADAGRAVAAGHTTIADATFLDPAHRQALRTEAEARGVKLHGFWLQAPLSALEARIERRRGDASDASVAVLRSAAANDPGPGNWEPIDTTDLATAIEFVKARLSSADAPAPHSPAASA